MLKAWCRKIGCTLRRVGLLGTARKAIRRGLLFGRETLFPSKRATRLADEARLLKLRAEFYAREAEFDRIHNVNTRGRVLLDTLDEVVGTHRYAGWNYEGADPDVLRKWIKALPIDWSQYTFIDFGSGKGRTLLVAAEFPFRRVRGVEFATALNSVAEKNIADWRGLRRCWDVRSELADAADYRLPDGPLFVFIYNPFHKVVMDRVLANILQSHREQPRDIWVVYWTSVQEDLLTEHGFARIPHPPKGPAIINYYGSPSSVWRLFPPVAPAPLAFQRTSKATPECWLNFRNHNATLIQSAARHHTSLN
jgi:SAM-dependent methyltransferase